jgi:hypothetical protein
MLRFLGFLLLLAGLLPAQERRAVVELDDGRVLQGTVRAMDLTTLQLVVGDVVHQLPATRIRSCRFEPVPPLAPAAADPAPAQKAPRITWREPLPAPEDTSLAEHVPNDLRGRSRWRARLERVDEVYPWLVPTLPSQWCSLGLLLLALSSLVVHMSTRVAGVETASFPRSLFLASWYLVTAALQVALVPATDFAVVLMLLSNTALALFWLVALFGLTRIGAIISFAVQLGFAAVVYGLLELVTAVLASVGMAP